MDNFTTKDLLKCMVDSDFIYRKGGKYGMTAEQRETVRALKDSDAEDALDLALIKALRGFLAALEASQHNGLPS